MAYIGFEQVVADGTVKSSTDLTIPAHTQLVELQSDTQDIRYTMDGSTDPSQTSGMVLATTHVPKLFLADDIQNIRFTRGNASSGNLNIHYSAGRDV